MNPITSIKDSKLRLELLKSMIKRQERVVEYKNTKFFLPDMVHIRFNCLNCGNELKPFFAAQDVLDNLRTLIKCPFCRGEMNKTELLVSK